MSNPCKLYTYRGQQFTIYQLAAVAGVPTGTLYARIKHLGYSVEDAVSGAILKCRPSRTYEHAGRKLTLREWSDVVGVPLSTLRRRLSKRGGWTLAQALTVPTIAQRRAGVVSNFPSVPGTGAGSSLQESPNIGIFSE